ncbi:unnamed protein product, partial [marine sediment metagenome]
RTQWSNRLMRDPKKMMGLKVPGDESVSVPSRHWFAMKLALWRSKAALDIAQRAAKDIVDACKHEPECAGKTNELEVCRPGCPDREIRLSALVVLNAARQFAPIVTKPADAPYYAPSREHFSEVLAALAAAQAELESIRGSAITTPPEPSAPALKEAP